MGLKEWWSQADRAFWAEWYTRTFIELCWIDGSGDGGFR